MSNLRNKVQALAGVFVEELLNEIASEMTAAFEGSFSLGTEKKSAPRRAQPAKTKGRAKGAKRDPKALAELTHDLEAVIKSKPGQRIEEIGKIMSVATKDLALPVKKLLAAKRIRVTGQRRATKYFPAGGGASKSSPKKASKKSSSKKSSSKKKK